MTENGDSGPYYVYCAEDVAVVVAGLQILGDVSKCAQVLRILSRTRDVPYLVFRDNVLQWNKEKGQAVKSCVT